MVKGGSPVMLPPSRSAATEALDASPVPDLALVATVASCELPTAPLVTSPVTSGSWITHPASEVSKCHSAYSEKVATVSSPPTVAKSGPNVIDYTPYYGHNTDLNISSTTAAAASVTGTSVSATPLEKEAI